VESAAGKGLRLPNQNGSPAAGVENVPLTVRAIGLPTAPAARIESPIRTRNVRASVAGIATSRLPGASPVKSGRWSSAPSRKIALVS
jgi:hypothetical protein